MTQDVGTADADLARPTKVKRIVFALCCATSFILYLHRYTFSMVKNDVIKDFELSTFQAGVLDSAFNGAYAIGQIPGGMLGDWFGTRVVLAAMILLWSAAFAGSTACRGFWDTFLVRTLFGFSQAGCYPNLGKVTKSWFPASMRTVVQGLVASFSGRLGGAASYLLVGSVLMGYYGLHWKTATLVFSVFGILLGVIFFVLYRNSPSEHPGVNEAEAREISADPTAVTGTRSALDWGTAFRHRTVRALVIQQFAAAYVDNFFSAWLPMFLLQQKGMKMSQGGWMSAVPLLGGAVGGVFGGTLQQVLIRRTGNRRWSRSAVGCAGSLLAMSLMFLSLRLANPGPIIAAFFALKFFADWSQPTTWASVSDIAGRSSASVFAIINTSGSIGGFLAGGIMGWMIGYFGGDSKNPSLAGWNALFVSLACLYLASAVSWLFVDCTKVIDEGAAASQGTA